MLLTWKNGGQPGNPGQHHVDLCARHRQEAGQGCHAQARVEQWTPASRRGVSCNSNIYCTITTILSTALDAIHIAKSTVEHHEHHEQRRQQQRTYGFVLREDGFVSFWFYVRGSSIHSQVHNLPLPTNEVLSSDENFI